MSLVSLLVGLPQKGTRVQRNIKGGNTATIFLDATVKEDFSAPIEPTTHPVENGPDITDHVILRPQKLSIEGIISDTPFSIEAQAAGIATTVAATVGQALGGALGGVVGAVAGSKTLAGVLQAPSSIKVTDKDGKPVTRESTESGDNGRLRDAINEFMTIRAEKQPVTIITGLKQYRNFLLTSFQVSRDQQTGGSIRVNLEFQELIIANSQTIRVPIPATKAGLPKQEQGRKNATESTGKQGSLLYDGIKGIFGG